MHVLVEADGDKLAALRKQPLSIRNSDILFINVADLKLALRQETYGLLWLLLFLLLLSLFLTSSLCLFEKQHIDVKVELFSNKFVTYFAWLDSSTLAKQFLLQEIASSLGYHLFWIVRLLASRNASLTLSVLVLYTRVHHAPLGALCRRFDEPALTGVLTHN